MIQFKNATSIVVKTLYIHSIKLEKLYVKHFLHIGKNMMFCFLRLIKITLHLNVKEWARIYLEGMSD